MEPEQKIVLAAKARGMGAAELTARSGVSRSTVYALFGGEARDIALDKGIALARACEVSLDWVADPDAGEVPAPGEPGTALTEKQKQILDLSRIMGEDEALARLLHLGSEGPSRFGPTPRSARRPGSGRRRA